MPASVSRILRRLPSVTASAPALPRASSPTTSPVRLGYSRGDSLERGATPRSILTAPTRIPATAPIKPGEVLVAEWNMENAFDAVHDAGKKDLEFTPEGKQHWTDAKVAQKLHNAGKVIRAMGGGRGPDVLGLVEVENKGVLERLRDEELSDLGYQTLVLIEGPDERGIDNGLLSRFPLVGKPKLHRMDVPGDPLWNRPTRGVLEVNLDAGGVPLTVFVNHWPSMRGGEVANAQRMQVAAKVRELVKEAEAKDPSRAVLVIGDLNTSPGNQALGPTGLSASSDPLPVAHAAPGALLWDAVSSLPKDQGTHTYHGHWSYLDHALLSQGALDNRGLTYVRGSLTVMGEPWMRKSNGEPLRFVAPTDRDMQFPEKTGYSDHLPLVFRLRRV